MMTATTRKTSRQNKHLRSCDHFAVIPSCSYNVGDLCPKGTCVRTAEFNTETMIYDYMFKLSSKPQLWYFMSFSMGRKEFHYSACRTAHMHYDCFS